MNYNANSLSAYVPKICTYVGSNRGVCDVIKLEYLGRSDSLARQINVGTRLGDNTLRTRTINSDSSCDFLAGWMYGRLATTEYSS